MRSESDEYYDLVKRSTGEIVGSIRAAGRALVYTANELLSKLRLRRRITTNPYRPHRSWWRWLPISRHSRVRPIPPTSTLMKWRTGRRTAGKKWSDA